MQKDLELKKQKEKKIVTLMIKIYCKGKKHSSNVPCSSCSELIKYANERVEKCAKLHTKTFCSKCDTHCYKPDMQEKIKIVMRYSGPRMLFHHPIMAMRHMFQ